ncbi:MAG: 1-(5-phosphoribosyl)-5-[(5-phosphoribosylamino)methylideneamino]imidazole-4-carboxamide isomerase [Chitinophagales bacterium]
MIIPAIDIINGQCVRLTQGDYEQKKVYNANPLEVAEQFEAAGITRLHLVDLDGAKAQHIVNHKVLEQIATHTKLQIDFGGGLKSHEDVRIAFESGASQITGGTIAVKNQSIFLEWLEEYGSEKIILGADVRNAQIAVGGWQEQTNLDLFDFLQFFTDKGIQYVICTDISKDGMMEGPAFKLYQQILAQFPQLKLIASGGVSNQEDIDRLEKMNLYGIIVGKAIYEGKVELG